LDGFSRPLHFSPFLIFQPYTQPSTQ